MIEEENKFVVCNPNERITFSFGFNKITDSTEKLCISNAELIEFASLESVFTYKNEEIFHESKFENCSIIKTGPSVQQMQFLDQINLLIFTQNTS